jgi:hypothetical protein
MADFFLCLKTGTTPWSKWDASGSEEKMRTENADLFKIIDPIISKLVDRIALDRSDDVPGYFNRVLLEMMKSGEIETFK